MAVQLYKKIFHYQRRKYLLKNLLIEHLKGLSHQTRTAEMMFVKALSQDMLLQI
jgi:hypothetical protein